MQATSLTRLRWRMRGAWLWPAFLAATILGGFLFERLPPTGDGTDLVAGLLLAGFLNLATVIVVGGFGGLALRRRRPDLPADIARDYAATTGVGIACLVLLGTGLLHRPAVQAREHDMALQQRVARDYIAHRGPPDARANAGSTDTLRLDVRLFRTCAPLAEPDRAFCVYVDTSQSPPGIRVDRSRATNAMFAPASD